jgi:energy-coupling factor transporter ATP-binding protein EcfA2
MKSGVDAVVIADHNTHDGIDKARLDLSNLRAEKPQGFREIVLFSGVELTVDGGYHLLGIFDVDTPSEEVNGLLHVCGYTAERGSSLGTTKMSFGEVAEQIVKRGGLAVPAHADAAKGLFGHDLRNQNDLVHSKYIVAVETVTDAGAKKAVERGWVRVLGSDAHHLDGSGCPEGIEAKYPGSHFTWVKMESPNLLGLKLAISDGNQSVIPAREGGTNPNEFTHSMIQRLIVKKDDQERVYSFSPWMNAVIGGRGVGKSTLIELIRLAMSRFTDLPGKLQNDNDWFSPQSGQGASSRFWNKKTRVEVHILRHGHNYRVIWDGNQPDSPTIEVSSDGEWRAEGGAPRDRFSLLISSQKQIYETAQDPQSLLKTIDDQPSIDYVTWKETFDELCGQYRTQRSEINELNIKIASEDRINGELSDIRAELLQIAEQRDSPEAHELDSLNQLERDSAQVETAAVKLETAVKGLAEEFDDPLGTVDISVEGDSKDEWEPEKARRSEIVRAYEALTSVVRILNQSRSNWEAVQEESPRKKRIEELSNRLNPVNDDTDTTDRVEDPNDANNRLVAAKNERETALREIDQAKKRRDQLMQDSSDTLRQITDQRADLTRRRSALANKLSNTQLRLHILAQASTSIESDLRRILEKPSSFDSVFSDSGLPIVLGHPFKPGRDKRVRELKNLLLQLRSSSGAAPLLEKYSDINIDQRFFTHLASLDPYTFETEVNLWFPEDRLRVQYQQEGVNGLSEIDQGSPGQKTAALLAVILQLNNDPLLLDQPEDDLDNKLIYDLVVTTLKRIKADRQVIVVTHNANVVVNADAEHVTILRHGYIPEVEAHGSIQRADMKQSICLIMEGGKQAFADRYKRLLG